jgi:flagellar hook-associated protein 3 FlgL
LSSINTDMDLQYGSTLSRLQDCDYAEAISKLTQLQTGLEASQMSFMRLSGLSLFNFLR